MVRTLLSIALVLVAPLAFPGRATASDSASVSAGGEACPTSFLNETTVAATIDAGKAAPKLLWDERFADEGSVWPESGTFT